jgi:osmotically-inducible protein OsmY
MTRQAKRTAAPPADAEIFAAARLALDQAGEVPAGVRIHVEHGYATLTGTVQWPRESEIAQRVVRDVPGVVGVINNIVVAHLSDAGGFDPRR